MPVFFFASGYTEAERATYEEDVRSYVDTLLRETPFRQYREHFVLVRVWTPSLKSGVATASSDSVFGGIFLRNGLPATDNPGFIDQLGDSSFGCGNGWESDLFQFNKGVIVLNATTRGAVASNRWALVPRGRPSMLFHELGHSLGYLSDEYGAVEGAGVGSTWDSHGNKNHEVRNVWRNLSIDSIPWKTWLTKGTPVPTPATPQYDGVVGVFEGGDHLATGRWRPWLDCRMRTDAKPFCPVCREALVWAFLSEYGGSWGSRVALDTVHPLPSIRAYPGDGAISGGMVVVRRIPGDTVPVSLRWRFAGTWLPQTGDSIDVASLPGSGELEAHLVAASPFIRNPDLVSRDTLRWTVRKPLSVVRARSEADGIRRIGPSLFLVREGMPPPARLLDASGRAVPTVIVGTTPSGTLVGGFLGRTGVLFLER